MPMGLTKAMFIDLITKVKRDRKLSSLPRDYVKQRDIEIILREMAEQVAVRLRRAGKKSNSSFYTLRVF